MPVHPQVAAQLQALLRARPRHLRFAAARSVSSAAWRLPSSAMPRSTDADLVGALDAVADLARDRRIPLGVPQRDLAGVSPAVLEPLAGVLADRLQHPEPVALAVHLHERLVDERLQLVEAWSRRALRRRPRRRRAVHPPAKTAIRRKRRCSGSVRSEWLQSIVARSVCCRSGVSRGPEVSTSRAWSSRSSSASGERSRSRAAASSSASGRPSRRRQTAATAAAFCGVSSNEPSRRSRALDEQRDGRIVMSDSVEPGSDDGGSASGASGYSRSAAILQRRPAGDHDPEPRAALDQPGDLRSSRHDLLEVVQEQERLLVADQGDDPVAERPSLRPPSRPARPREPA